MVVLEVVVARLCELSGMSWSERVKQNNNKEKGEKKFIKPGSLHRYS